VHRGRHEGGVVAVGRRKTPIRHIGPAATFAAELRTARMIAGMPTYRKMASAANWSHNGLAGADRGDRLPTWRCAAAYLRACGADDDELTVWHEKWKSTARAIAMRAELAAMPWRMRPPSRPRRGASAPPSTDMLHAPTTGEHLVDDLNWMLAEQQLTIEEVAERINDPDLALPYRLPTVRPAMLRAALTTPALPPLPIVIRIIAACGGTHRDLGDWFSIWHTIKTAEERALAQLETVKAEARRVPATRGISKVGLPIRIPLTRRSEPAGNAEPDPARHHAQHRAPADSSPTSLPPDEVGSDAAIAIPRQRTDGGRHRSLIPRGTLFSRFRPLQHG
jgi:hypothetical protein